MQIKFKVLKQIVEFSYFVFLVLVDGVCAFCYSPRNDNTPKKVLIVRPDAIGDFILWLSAAKRLRELYPEGKYELVLIGNELWTKLAKDTTYFDEVWEINRQKFVRNLFYRNAILRRVYQASFTTAIYPVYSREFQLGDSIVRASRAAERIGSAGDYSNISFLTKKISDKWYTWLIPASKVPLMELERNAEFMRGLGLPEFKASIPELPISCKAKSDENIKDYYVLIPGTSSGLKQWPVSNFKVLAEQIYRVTGLIGILCGGPGEELLGSRLVQGNDIPLQNKIGLTTLQEMTSIISGARFLIGNDTGAVHIAVATSTPSICILGGGHFGRFEPYNPDLENDGHLPACVFQRMECFGCNWQCIYGYNDTAAPCISNISVDAVWNAVQKILLKG